MIANSNNIKSQIAFLMLQSGNSILNNFNVRLMNQSKCIFIMGRSKAGKTTFSHISMGHQVKGKLIEEKNQILYELKNCPNEYMQARIGMQTVSETQIPNIFQKKVSNEKIILCDCPGFQDSYGCFRSISNLFFVHLLFQSARQINFLIVIKYHDLSGQGLGLSSTFSSFFSIFNDISLIIDSILPSISLVVTDVPSNITKQNLKNTLLALNNFPGKEIHKAVFIKIKNYLISKQKIFKISKAQKQKVAPQCSLNPTMLESILKLSPVYWKKQNYDNPIKISIADYMSSDTSQFNRQLNLFSKFYDSQVKTNLGNIKQIFNTMIKILSHDPKLQNSKKQKEQFYKLIQEQIQKKNSKINDLKKNNQFREIFDNYLDIRNNCRKKKFQFLQSNIFDLYKYPSLASNLIPCDLLRMKILKQTLEKFQTQMKIHGEERNKQQIFRSFEIIKQIFNLLIFYSKNYLTQIHKNFVQFIQNVLTQTELMLKIFQIFINTAQQKNINMDKPPQEMQFIYEKFPSDFKLIFNLKQLRLRPDNNYLTLLQYMEDMPKIVKIQQTKPVIYEYRSQFLQELIQFFQKKQEQWLKGNYIALQRLKNTIQIVKRVSIQFIYKKLQQKITSNKSEQRQQILSLIENIRKKNQKYMKGKNKLNIEYQINLNLKILNMQAYYFKKIKQNQSQSISCQIYKALYNAYEVLRYYQQKQVKMEKDFSDKSQKSLDKLLQFFIQYMNISLKFSRTDISMVKAQRAFALAMEKGDNQKMIQIGKKIKTISKNQLNQSQDQYLQFIQAEYKIVKLPQQLQKKIQSFIEKQSPTKVQKKK